MRNRTRDIKKFLFSQYLADGLRTTISIALPAIIFAWLGNLEEGLIISLGALCISICDIPGPVKHKRNGMFYCNCFVFIMALLTGLVNSNHVLLGILIIVSSFFFSMLSVYGNRSASIGTAALLIMILTMTTVTRIAQSVIQSILILCGGVWYMLLALFFYRLTPYRPAQRSLGECMHETAKYLRIKSALYDTRTNIDDEYKKLVTQQVTVNEKQENVRELLFKNRAMLRESISSGRLLVLTFADLVDLFEHIMASWYDYDLLRQKFFSSAVLESIADIIKKIADELDNIAYSIQSNSNYEKQYDAIADLNQLKTTIDLLHHNDQNVFILKKILINLRDLNFRVSNLSNYFTSKVNRPVRNFSEYSKFVKHQSVNPAVFANNLTLQSSVFRHSLRVMITCGIGFIISKMFAGGHHSYWILLTIIVILKPGYSLTKKRNVERFIGTLSGGIIGVLLLAFIHDRYIIVTILILLMIGTYTFQRLNYIIMVIFMTPYILILFSLLGLPVVDVAKERLTDTAIASVLSFAASYLLFPHWESEKLADFMAAVLKANVNYLRRAVLILMEDQSISIDYKLIRKEVFLATANLSGAFNRMLSEPRNKQRNKNEIYQFVALNNVLSSNIASLITYTTSGKNIHANKEEIHLLRQSMSNLQQGISAIDAGYIAPEEKTITAESSSPGNMPDPNFMEQLHFVNKLTATINKVTNHISK